METVSIHAPAGGATSSPVSITRGSSSFNPRARGGRDQLEAGGAVDLINVSIHAPAGGATTTSRFSAVFGIRFNPRARGGRDSAQRLAGCS